MRVFDLCIYAQSNHPSEHFARPRELASRFLGVLMLASFLRAAGSLRRSRNIVAFRCRNPFSPSMGSCLVSGLSASFLISLELALKSCSTPTPNPQRFLRVGALQERSASVLWHVTSRLFCTQCTAYSQHAVGARPFTVPQYPTQSMIVVYINLPNQALS